MSSNDWRAIMYLQHEYERREAKKEREARDRRRRLDQAQRRRESKARQEKAERERKERERRREHERYQREVNARIEKEKKEHAIELNKEAAAEYEELIGVLSNLCTRYKNPQVDLYELIDLESNLISFKERKDECGLTEDEAEEKDKIAIQQAKIFKRFSGDVLVGNEGACLLAIDKLSCLNKNPYTEGNWKANLKSKDSLEMVFKLDIENNIPDIKIGVTETGKHQEIKMGKSEYYELCLKFVSGCVALAVRDVYEICPTINNISVLVLECKIDGATGNDIEMPILQCSFVREKCREINFNKIDTADFMMASNPNVNFLKTKGFQAIHVEDITEQKQGKKGEKKPSEKSVKADTSKAKTKSTEEKDMPMVTIPQDFNLRKGDREELQKILQIIATEMGKGVAPEFITRKNDAYVIYKSKKVKGFAICIVERKVGYSFEVDASTEFIEKLRKSESAIFSKHNITPHDFNNGQYMAFTVKSSDEETISDMIKILEPCKKMY